MTTRVIQNVEQYNRDMFKLQDANKDTPPVGVRQFRNPFMQQSVNALLTAILAKGTGSGSAAVPVSSINPGGLDIAGDTAEASGVFRRPDKTGRRVRRPDSEARGERVGAKFGNVEDTRQEGLSEKAKAAGDIAEGVTEDLQQKTQRLKKLQDAAGAKNTALTSASAVRQKALQDEIDEYDSALKTLGQIDIEKKKALKRARGSGGDKNSGPEGKKKRKKLIKKLTAEVEDNLTQMKRIRKTERVSAVNRMAAERRDLAKSLLKAGIKTQREQNTANKKVKIARTARASTAAEAGKALSAAKGFSKALTTAQSKKDAKAAASAAKKAKKDAKKAAEDAAEGTVSGILKKGLKAKKAKEKAAKAAKAKAEKAAAKAAELTPGRKEAGGKVSEGDKHNDATANEKKRQSSTNHKVSTTEQHDKHTTKADKQTAKELKSKSTTPTRIDALRGAQLKTLEAYSKMTAYDAANPKVTGGKYLFRVNTQTDSQAEITKERKDWEKWSAEHTRLNALYIKARKAQNDLLAKQPTLRGGGVRGAGTRPGAVQTGGGSGAVAAGGGD